MRFRPRFFTTKPWEESFGDPAAPTEVLGVRVTRLVVARADQPGALALLEDGAFALTGEVLARGAHDDMATYLRRRARRSHGPERTWLDNCRKAVTAERAQPAEPHASDSPRGTPESTPKG